MFSENNKGGNAMTEVTKLLKSLLTLKKTYLTTRLEGLE